MWRDDNRPRDVTGELRAIHGPKDGWCNGVMVRHQVGVRQCDHATAGFYGAEKEMLVRGTVAMERAGSKHWNVISAFEGGAGTFATVMDAREAMFYADPPSDEWWELKEDLQGVCDVPFLQGVNLHEVRKLQRWICGYVRGGAARDQGMSPFGWVSPWDCARALKSRFGWMFRKLRPHEQCVSISWLMNMLYVDTMNEESRKRGEPERYEFLFEVIDKRPDEDARRRDTRKA